MSESTVQWNSYQTAREVLRESSVSGVKLIVLCFAEKWNKVSMYVAQMFERIRKSGDVPFAQILIVDASDNEAAWEYSIAVTPSVIFFWEGKPFNIQRPNWDDDVKIVGAISEENYISMIRFARETGEAGHMDLVADIV